MTTMNNCLLCYNGLGEGNSTSCSSKLSELCCKYLHYALTQEYLQGSSKDKNLVLCRECLESAVELVDLNDQMDMYQKRISELVFILSLEILHRRGKSVDNNKNCGINMNDPVKNTLMEVDISCLPKYSRNVTCTSEISDSSAKRSHLLPLEDNCDEVGDVSLTPRNSLLTSNNENNITDTITIEIIKCEYDQQFLGVEGIESCHTEAVSPTENEMESVPTTTTAKVAIGNPLFPILKLHRLQFHDSDINSSTLKIEKDKNNDLSGQELRKRKSQSVGRSNELRRCYKSTSAVANQKLSFQTCEENSLAPTHFSASTPSTDSDSVSNSSSNGQKQISTRNQIIETDETDHSTVEASSTFLKEYSLECPVCSKRFKWYCQLKAHSRNHTGEKPFDCDFCGMRFTRKDRMLRHKKIHTGEKAFKCDFCEKRFVRKDQYLRHRSIHTGERPFKCDFCDKKFTQKSSMLFHRRIHTEDKPLKCDLCDYSTFIKLNLKSHKIRRHSSLTNFQCRECKIGFKTAKNVERHYKRIHFALDFTNECVIKKTF